MVNSIINKEYFETLSNFLKDYNLIHDDNNLIDQIWKDKPTYSKEKVIVHDIKFSGETSQSKYKRIKEFLKAKVEGDKIALLSSRLDDIACKFNNIIKILKGLVIYVVMT